MQYWLVRCPIVTAKSEDGGNRHAKVLDIPDAGKTGKNLGYSEAVEDGQRLDGVEMVICLAFGEDLSGLLSDPEITVLSKESTGGKKS